MTYGRSLTLPSPTGEDQSLDDLCDAFWTFAFADGRNGRLTLRDLVVFHQPNRSRRLLELIDQNTDDVDSNDDLSVDEPTDGVDEHNQSPPKRSNDLSTNQDHNGVPDFNSGSSNNNQVPVQ